MSPAHLHPYLLIDNSNSRTKLAAADADALAEKRTIPTADLDAASLEDLTRDLSCDRIVLSSVVPEKARLLRDYFMQQNGREILEISHRLKLGVAIDFPDPSTIGADRLANAAAVVALHHPPAVVVDFGTAVTFDVISADKAYIGGVIAPGLEVMTEYLSRRTALLPQIDLSEPPEVVGTSTENAMLSGVVHGYRGLIKEILAEIEKEAGAPLDIIATGGYADLIASKLPVIQSVDPDLTLQGLRIIANLNP